MINLGLARYWIALLFDVAGAGTLYMVSKNSSETVYIIIFFTLPILLFVIPLYLLKQISSRLQQIEKSPTSQNITTETRDASISYIDWDLYDKPPSD